MNTLKAIAGVILSIAIVAGISAGIRATTNSTRTNNTLKSDTSEARASYKQIGLNACLSEAKKPGSELTLSQANQYCKCITDKLYVGTVADMQKMDAEYKENGFTATQEQDILNCAEALYQ